MEPDIIVNSTLTPEDRAAILERHINRNTTDSPWSPYARKLAGMPPATETDQEWIEARVWERLPDGSIRLAPKVAR